LVHWRETFLNSGAIFYDSSVGFEQKPIPLVAAVKILERMVGYANLFGVAFAVSKSEFLQYAHEVETMSLRVYRWSILHRTVDPVEVDNRVKCRCSYGKPVDTGIYGNNLVWFSPCAGAKDIVRIRKGPMMSSSVTLPELTLYNKLYRKPNAYAVVDLVTAVMLELGVTRLHWEFDESLLGDATDLGSCVHDTLFSGGATRLHYGTMSSLDRAIQDGLSNATFYLDLKRAGKGWRHMMRHRLELLVPKAVEGAVAMWFPGFQSRLYRDVLDECGYFPLAGRASHNPMDLVVDLGEAAGPRNVDFALVRVQLDAAMSHLHIGEWVGQIITDVSVHDMSDAIGSYVDVALSRMFLNAVTRLKEGANVVVEVPTLQAVPTLMHMLRSYVNHFHWVKFSRVGASDPLIMQYQIHFFRFSEGSIGPVDQVDYFSAMAALYDRAVVLYRNVQVFPRRDAFTLGDCLGDISWKVHTPVVSSHKTGNRIPLDQKEGEALPRNNFRFHSGVCMVQPREAPHKDSFLKELIRGKAHVMSRVALLDDLLYSDIYGDLNVVYVDSEEADNARYRWYRKWIRARIAERVYPKLIPLTQLPSNTYAHIKSWAGITMAATGYCTVCQGPSRAYRYSALLNGCRCFMKKGDNGERNSAALVGIYDEEEEMEKELRHALMLDKSE